MEWKIYIRNLLIGLGCFVIGSMINHYYTKNSSDKIIIQNKAFSIGDSDESIEPSSTFEIELHDDTTDFSSQQKFVTCKERFDLFKELNIEYLDHEEFDYAPAQQIDARLTEMYLENPAEYEDLSYNYKDNIEAQTLVPLSIQWLGKDIGYGIFAETAIYENEFIGTYTGKVQDRSLIDTKDYAWYYPIKTEEGGAVSLDGYNQGNELRFINDGIHPNCVVKYVIGNDDLWHICYVALTDIKKGDQLLISYGPDYWDTRLYDYQELADTN